MQKSVTVKNKFQSGLVKSAVLVTALSGFAFADDGNLSSSLPTSLVDSGIWQAAALVFGAVVAVKGIQIVIRLIKRV